MLTGQLHLECGYDLLFCTNGRLGSATTAFAREMVSQRHEKQVLALV